MPKISKEVGSRVHNHWGWKEMREMNFHVIFTKELFTLIELLTYNFCPGLEMAS
jgi:hypothetical protein